MKVFGVSSLASSGELYVEERGPIRVIGGTLVDRFGEFSLDASWRM